MYLVDNYFGTAGTVNHFTAFTSLVPPSFGQQQANQNYVRTRSLVFLLLSAHTSTLLSPLEHTCLMKGIPFPWPFILAHMQTQFTVIFAFALWGNFLITYLDSYI